VAARARAAMTFWARTRNRDEEYSYCGTAFTMFAISEAQLVLRGEMPRAEAATITASIGLGCRWLACRRKRLDRLFASSCPLRAGMPLRRVMLDRHARRLADWPRVPSLAAVLGSANRRRPGQVPRFGSLAFASNRRRLSSVYADDRQSRDYLACCRRCSGGRGPST
jgi:hypothetical protein